MAEWYGVNNKVDFNTRNNVLNSPSNGASAAKGISEAFNGFGQILEDRAKLEKETAELDRKKAIEDEDRKIRLQTAYDLKQEKTDAKAQEEINNEVFKEMVKYKTKEEFDKNVNPDLVKFADGKTVVATEAFYNKSAQEQAALKQAASDAENKIKLAEMGLKLQEQKVKTESAKGKAESSDNRSVKAADDSLIGKNIATLFGGVYNPTTGKITGLDKDNAKKVLEIQAGASKIFKENKNITHNEASNLAFQAYEKSIATPPSPPTNDIKKTEENTFNGLKEYFSGDKINESIIANTTDKKAVTDTLSDKLQNPEQAARLKKLEEIKNKSLK